MEVLLADAGRAVAVVITDGVLAGKGVLATAARVEGAVGELVLLQWMLVRVQWLAQVAGMR